MGFLDNIGLAAVAAAAGAGLTSASVYRRISLEYNPATGDSAVTPPVEWPINHFPPEAAGAQQAGGGTVLTGALKISIPAAEFNKIGIVPTPDNDRLLLQSSVGVESWEVTIVERIYAGATVVLYTLICIKV